MIKGDFKVFDNALKLLHFLMVIGLLAIPIGVIGFVLWLLATI